MFGLTPTTTAVILTIVLVAVALAYLLFGWLRKRSWRVMLRGVGFALVPLGLLAMGLMTMIVNGIQAVVDWANATVMTYWIMIGLIVAGVGIVAYLIGSFVPQVTGDEASTRREAIKARKLAALQATSAAPKPATPAPAAKPAAPSAPAAAPASAKTPSPAPSAAATNPDDKEIDDILRSHGIN